VKKSFNIQELLYSKSKRHGTKPMHPSSSRAFQRHQEHNLKHLSSVDLIITKQNKIPSFIDRLVWLVLLAQVFSRSQLIFPSKAWLFEIYLNFQWQKSLKNQYLPHFESKSYQINSIKSCSSSSFQQHQMHIPIPPKFSARI
jgi:hypothetical protein